MRFFSFEETLQYRHLPFQLPNTDFKFPLPIKKPTKKLIFIGFNN